MGGVFLLLLLFSALVEREGAIVNYVINGNWVVSWPGDVKAAGTVVKYTRKGNLEIIEAPGPTDNELHVMVRRKTRLCNYASDQIKGRTKT